MIVSAREGPLELSSIDSPVRASAEHAAALRQRRLGVIRDAVLDLRADHEQDQRQQQPADDRERDPLQHPAGCDRLARLVELGFAAGDAAEPALEGVQVAAARERAPARAVDLVLRRGRILVGHVPLYIVRPCRLGE
jgi:hypothetical protein